MASIKGLTLWVLCPKHTRTLGYRNVTHCAVCDYYAGESNGKLLCIYEDK